jgi:Fungal peroxidase extension region
LTVRATGTLLPPQTTSTLIFQAHPSILHRVCSTRSSLLKYNSAARSFLVQLGIKARLSLHSKGRCVSSQTLSLLGVSDLRCIDEQVLIYLWKIDPRTACTWQSFVNNQDGMANAFRDAMAKLAVLGQDISHMVDCSEVIPESKPLPAANCHSVYPAGITNADVEQAVLLALVDVEPLTDHRLVSALLHHIRTFQLCPAPPPMSILCEYNYFCFVDGSVLSVTAMQLPVMMGDVWTYSRRMGYLYFFGSFGSYGYKISLDAGSCFSSTVAA